MTEFSHIIFTLANTLRHSYANTMRKMLTKYEFIEYTMVVTLRPHEHCLPMHLYSQADTYFIKPMKLKDKVGFNVKFNGANTLVETLKELGYESHLASANASINSNLGLIHFTSLEYHPKDQFLF